MLGLSNSTASHAEPFEPGKGSNRTVRRREHGRTGAHGPAAHPLKWGRDPPFSPRRDATKRPSYRDLALAARTNPHPDRAAPSETWANWAYGFTSKSRFAGPDRLLHRPSLHGPGCRIPRPQAKTPTPRACLGQRRCPWLAKEGHPWTRENAFPQDGA